MIFRRRPLHVSAPRIDQHKGCTRVTALVNRRPLWFESDDIELSPSPEAFASALLLASQHRGQRLVIEAPVDETWLKGVEGVIAKWSEWWGYEPLRPSAGVVSRPARSEANKRALSFSSGVDSFFSLLKAPKPDFLVTVHGFDIPLADIRRMERLRRSLLEIAEQAGARPIIIRTNLREHPANGRRYLWERSHGGALAAIGQLFAPSIAQYFISSTYSLARDRPWGSSPNTDTLFSLSDLEIVHFGTEPREEKILGILSHPMVRGHLRVCWENRKPEGNCSRCAKCLLVMTHLLEYGVLEEFEVFEGGKELAQRLDAVPYSSTHIAVMERAVGRGRLPTDVSAATTRLIERSHAAAKWSNRRKRVSHWAARYV